MNYVYLAFVRPIELLLGLVFGLWLKLSGNPGVSLLLMSLSVTLLTAPLYYLAERWKAADDEMKARMARETRSVKRHYEGQKRFYLIRNIHRLHGYSTLYTIKASFGLFVQIPFFFAAYELLSKHSGFAGIPFLFIRDLGRADGLLGGINLLPFAMTAINLCSSVAYTRSLSPRKNSTMALMALLFLVLLYKSPAALLVYWTSNNLLSLAKNLFFPARRAATPDDEEAEKGGLAAAAEALRELYGGSLARPALAAAAVLAVGAQNWWLVEKAASYELCVVATAALAAALSLGAAARSIRDKGLRAGAARLAPLAAAWILFAASAYFLLFERRQNAFISNRNIKMLSTLLLDLAAWIAAHRLLPERGAPARRAGTETHGRARREAAIFAAGVGVLSLFLFILAPLQMYFSSPKDVGMSPLALVGANAPAFLAASALGVAWALLAARRGKSAPAGAVVAAAIAALAFTALSSGRYGILDEFSLEKEFLLDRASIGLYLLDAAIILASAAAGRLLVMKKARLVPPAFALLAAIGAAQAGAAALKASPEDFAPPPTASAGGLPAGAAEAHRFSKDGRNVVFVIADMFNGNYLGRAVAERPEYAEKLDGFTWYPKTLAIASHTATSLPAIYGGWYFEPEKLNSVPGKGSEKIAAAAEKFFGGMAAKGYSLAATDPLYVDYRALLADKGGITVTESPSYVAPWKAAKGEPDAAWNDNPKNRLLSMVTLFRAAPFMLKTRIYDDGSWIVFRKSYQFKYIAKKTLENYAYLDLLPELSSAGPGGDRFLFVHTQFTHEPFGVDAKGEVITDDFPEPASRSFVDKASAYYTARRFLEFMLAWTDWMKKEGVYDNSLIVVMSDHGNKADDHDFKLPPALDNPFDRADASRANALFLVKPFGARGELRKDERFLSTADAPAILFNALGDVKAYGPPPPPAGKGRNLYFARIQGSWNDYLETETIGYTYYRVRGDMDKPEDWSKE